MTDDPLIIIGAARSGTNILRDTLTGVPGWSTWPCDEINLIWRHGNLHKSDDIFTRDDARPEVVRFIRSTFYRLARKTGASVIVEKTCANSMRVPFVEAIFPNARYLYIVRDGRDVALSAAQRWTASIEPIYLLRKLRFAPLRDVPHYAKRFISNRLHQLHSKARSQASWGPRFPGIDEWVETRPMIEVCAKQWAVSVDVSDSAFQSIDPDRVLRIRYEDFVSNPSSCLARIEQWYGASILAKLPDAAIKRVHAKSLGTWKVDNDQLTSESLAIMVPILKRYQYLATS